MKSVTRFALALLAAWSLAACEVQDKQKTLLLHDLAAAMPLPAGTHAFDTGTGFFIVDEGVLLTARHVVEQCRSIAVLSERIAPTPAAVIATDEHWDLAVLRVTAPLAVAPAHLTMSVVPAAAGALRAYGYPLAGDLRRASGADVKLINDTLPRLRAPPDGIVRLSDGMLPLPTSMAPQLRKAGWLLWLDGPLAEGYSGGPVLDPDGNVVGVTVGRGNTTPSLDGHFEAIGTWPIVQLLTSTAFKPSYVRTDEAADREQAERAAIVRVVCWQ